MSAPPPETRYSLAPANSTLPFWGVTPMSVFDSKGPRLSAPQVATRPQTARRRSELLAFIFDSLGRPVCRVTHVRYVLQIRQDGAAHGDHVYRTLLLVDHFSARREHHGVRHPGVPFGVKHGLQGVGVVGAEHQVAAGGVLRLQRLQNAGL